MAQADALVAVEPANSLWLEYDFRGRLSLARLLFVTGHRDEAAQQTSAACQAVNSLFRRPSSQTRMAYRAGRLPHAPGAALARERCARIRRLHWRNKRRTPLKRCTLPTLRRTAFLVARAYRLLGDIERARADVDGARSAWTSGLAAIPTRCDRAAERNCRARAHFCSALAELRKHSRLPPSSIRWDTAC